MFQLKTNEDKQYHFTLNAKNGQVILSSEMYSSKAAAENGIESVKKNAAVGIRFERKTSKNGKFYFNLKAVNGQIIGSSQMYSSESGMENGINSVKENAPNSEIQEV